MHFIEELSFLKNNFYGSVVQLVRMTDLKNQLVAGSSPVRAAKIILKVLLFSHLAERIGVGLQNLPRRFESGIGFDCLHYDANNCFHYLVRVIKARSSSVGRASHF